MKIKLYCCKGNNFGDKLNLFVLLPMGRIKSDKTNVKLCGIKILTIS